MSKKVIKIIFILLTAVLLILIGQTIPAKAADGEFSITEETLTLELNSSRMLTYENRPTRRNYNMGK